MNEEELLEKNNIILSHNKLPKGMSICENYGLSGNCGIKCPLFKNGTCEVYKDVSERIINNLQSKIDKVIKLCETEKKYIYDYAGRDEKTGKLLKGNKIELDVVNKSKILDILKENK